MKGYCSQVYCPFVTQFSLVLHALSVVFSIVDKRMHACTHTESIYHHPSCACILMVHEYIIHR